VLAATVVAVAVVGNRASGLMATVVAALSFDFFLTMPYEQLAFTHRADIETTVSLFVVGVVVTELAVRNRRHYQAATQESDFVELIHDLSEMAASGTPFEDVVDCAMSELIELLHLRSCRYQAGPADRRRARLEHDGHVIHGGMTWRVGTIGLPGPEIELLVRDRGTTVGRFVLKPTPGYPVPLEDRIVAAAIADQVGAALPPRLRTA